MKKFLSLVLALVMTMSLVTVSAGAKDFTDNSKINYAEAVDVMSAVKVIDGYAEGDFRPSTTLIRGAAAKIICNLILGPTTAGALVADAAPYKDVPTNHTFAGYIAYCQKEGIISGYADGTFRPANSLTGYAFMKMLLGALGYDGEVEGYTGPNWSVNVAKRALNIGLADDLVGDFNGVKAVTREEACLYALNTMTANMVEYDSKTSVSAGNTTVVIAGPKAKDMTNTAKTETIKDDGKMQFAGKYFEDLKLDLLTSDSTFVLATTASGTDIKAALDGTKMNLATGVTPAFENIDMNGKTAKANSFKTNATAATLLRATGVNADGTGYAIVKVDLDGATSVAPTYKVLAGSKLTDKQIAAIDYYDVENSTDESGTAQTVKDLTDGTLTSTTDKVLVECSATSGINKGQSVKMTVTPSPLTDMAAYTVTVVVNGKDYVFTNLTAADSKWITVEEIRVEDPVTKMALTGVKSNEIKGAVSEDKYTLTFSFSEDISLATGKKIENLIASAQTQAVGGSALDVVNVTYSGNTVTVRFADPLAENNEIKLATGIVYGVVASNEYTSAETLTVKAGAKDVSVA